jgi:hypothetical protein
MSRTMNLRLVIAIAVSQFSRKVIWCDLANGRFSHMSPGKQSNDNNWLCSWMWSTSCQIQAKSLSECSYKNNKADYILLERHRPRHSPHFPQIESSTSLAETWKAWCKVCARGEGPEVVAKRPQVTNAFEKSLSLRVKTSEKNHGIKGVF